jgi:hypothetical protein
MSTSPLQSPTLKGKEKESVRLGNSQDPRSASTLEYINAPAPVAPRKLENAFQMMPPEIIVILLPFYDLLNLNKAFCTLVYSQVDGRGKLDTDRCIFSTPSLLLAKDS